MPLYTDVHNHTDGLTADAIKVAHEQDVKVQGKHGVTYRSTGSTSRPAARSVWWKHPTRRLRMQCTARRMDWSQTS